MPYQTLQDRYLAGRRSAGLPVGTYLAVLGLVLIASLFFAGASLEIHKPTKDSPSPEARQNHYELNSGGPPPAPDMNSQAVIRAQPNSELGPLAKLHPDAHAARAEAPAERKRVTRPTDHQPNRYQQNQFIDRFSIRGQ
jgi:hypothetical protein